MSPFVYSSADDAIHVAVVTTTIFSTVPSSTSSSPLSTPVSHNIAFPFASVVGGSCAGIFLALTAVIGWKLWGRAIKRKDEILRKETLSNITTRKNTRQNASMFSPRTYIPTYAFPQERKVKFASSPASSEKLAESDSRPTPTATNSDLISTPSPPRKSQPWSPLITASHSHASSAQPLTDISTPNPPSLEPPASLVHKASTTSSISMYSTQSGEEHQVRPPARVFTRKFDHRRLSNFTRSSRSFSQYSALGDIDEQPQTTDNDSDRLI